MPETVVTEDGVVRTAEAAETLALPVRDPTAIAAEARSARRRLAFDTSDHAATTFVEGIVDALSIGLIRETGEEADLRRDVNAGTALAGNVLGFAAGLGISGPVRGITHTAEALGAAAARTTLKAGERAIVTRAASEAAASMALAGGQAFSHQLMDSLLEDKEFSSEAILHEVKLAGVLGAAGGVALGALGKMGRRDIAKQGGIVGDIDEALKPHYEALHAYDQVLERHAAEVGALRELHKAGQVSTEFLDARITALHRAAKARDALDAISAAKAMSGTDDVLYAKWQKAGVRHRAAIRQLDEVMQGKPTSLDDFVEAIPPKVDAPDAGTLSFADEAAEVAAPAGPALVGPKLDDPGQLAWGTVENVKVGPQLDEPGQLAWGTVESPLHPTDDLADLGMSDAKMARMRARLAETAGERAKFKDMAHGGNLVEPAPKPAPTPGKRRADQDTREIALSIDEADLRVRRPIQRAGELPDIWQGPRDADGVAIESPDGPGLTPPEKTPAGSPSAKRRESPELPPEAEASMELPMAPVDIPKPRPLDAAEAKVQAAMAELVERTGGRLDSADHLGLLGHVGIRPAGDNVGTYLDQVYALRKAGRLASAPKADSPLRSAFDRAIGAVAGGTVAGPAGAVVGAMFLRRGGRIAAAAGRLMEAASGAAQKLITSRKVRATAAAAANYPHAYSDRGPIADPVERIQEIQFLASNPEHIAVRVAENAKDLADQPQLLQALQARAVNQVQRLAMRAPAIMFDKLGRPLSPPVGKMREFFEYENAVHDLEGILKRVGEGSITKPEAAALQENFPSVQGKVALGLLADPDRLRKAPREVLRAVERVTGASLTNASDPMWLVRQAMAWVPPAPPAPPAKPQAYNINPDGAPTPSQSNATGRAPGN